MYEEEKKQGDFDNIYRQPSRRSSWNNQQKLHMEEKLNSMQMYVNMVIHDLRNPAYLIDSSLDELAFKLGIVESEDENKKKQAPEVNQNTKKCLRIGKSFKEESESSPVSKQQNNGNELSKD